MTMLRKALSACACLLLLACGPSEPESPLILGGDPQDVAPGPRTLTSSQERALLGVITSAGERCEGIVQTYLRDVDAGSGVTLESWDVRCSDGVYSVLIPEGGTPATVRPCPGDRYGNVPCFQPARGPRRQPDGAPALNPELGKLLEPMTAKDAKVD